MDAEKGFDEIQYLFLMKPAACLRSCSVAQSCPTLCNPMDCSKLGPLSMGFFRQLHWSVLPFPPPGYLPNTGIETASAASPALTGRFFIAGPPGKPNF